MIRICINILLECITNLRFLFSMSSFDKTKTIQKLFKQRSLLDIAIEVEALLDFMNVFVYENWNKGELVDGPHVSRYWITSTWRYDHKNMPDPMAARVLHDVGVIVNFDKSEIMEPIDVKTPQDFRPGTKVPKLRPIPVWHIEIKIPRRFIDDIDYNDLDDLDDEVDVDSIESAADTPEETSPDLSNEGPVGEENV